MPSIKRTLQDTIENLQEQHSFLKQSCSLYDSGNEKEAKRLALSLRILLHDTNRSNSILTQLDVKNEIEFLDSAHLYRKDNLLPSSCLTLIRISNHREEVAPLLDAYRNFHNEDILKKFTDWWQQIVLDDKRHQFSRKDLILLVANKDGGAHVDEDLPQKYHDLTRNDSMNFIISVNNIEKPIRNFVFASIRQIAFEVDTTFDRLRVDLWRG